MHLVTDTILLFSRFPVTLEWNGKVVGEKVVWFQFESDPSMNSNVFEVAQQIVQKHFPGEQKYFQLRGLFDG